MQTYPNDKMSLYITHVKTGGGKSAIFVTAVVVDDSFTCHREHEQDLPQSLYYMWLLNASLLHQIIPKENIVKVHVCPCVHAWENNKYFT